MEYEIIGIDHGFKNIKTAHFIFRTALTKLLSEPDDKNGVLEYKGEYYTIYGDSLISVNNHNKSNSLEYYLLTLVAMAMELEFRKKRKAGVYIAGGLPVKWYEAQKEDFRKLLIQNKQVHFNFEGKTYDIAVLDARIFKQGVAAYMFLPNADTDDSIIVDIGGETIDIIPLKDGNVALKDCKISTNATILLIKNIQEHIESVFYDRISEKDIIKAIIAGSTQTKDEYLKLVYLDLEKYCEDTFTLLKEFKYNLTRTQIVFVGGGALVIKNFGNYEKYNMKFMPDIKANAKGFEILQKVRLKK